MGKHLYTKIPGSQGRKLIDGDDNHAGPDLRQHPAIERAKSEQATAEFGYILAGAIHLGLESAQTFNPAVDKQGTERPLPYSPPIIPAAFDNGPPVERKVSRKQLDTERRQLFRDILRDRQAATNVRPPFNQLTIFDLANDTCRFPVTEDSPFLFCGRPPVRGKRYCMSHCRVAYGFGCEGVDRD